MILKVYFDVDSGKLKTKPKSVKTLDSIITTLDEMVDSSLIRIIPTKGSTKQEGDITKQLSTQKNHESAQHIN